MSSTFVWSAASEDSNSEWSKSNSWPAPFCSLGAVAVLLDRRLLKLRIALEPERLREADDGRGRGAGAAGELLGGLEGGLVEVVDDVAGDVLLRAGELVEALGDVGGERLAVRPRLAAVARRTRPCAASARLSRARLRGRLAHGGRFAPRGAFPASAAAPRQRHAARRCGWIAAMDAEQALRLTNRNMIAFDLALGSAALLAPRATLARARARRALARRRAPVPPLRPDLAHLRRGARGRRAPRRPAGLVGAGLAARHRARDRRRSGRARRPSRGRARGRDCGSRARATWRWRSASAGSPSASEAGAGGDAGCGAASPLRYPPAVPLGTTLHSLKPTAWASFRRRTWPAAISAWAVGVGPRVLSCAASRPRSSTAIPCSRASQVAVERLLDLRRRVERADLAQLVLRDLDQVLGQRDRPLGAVRRAPSAARRTGRAPARRPRRPWR